MGIYICKRLTEPYVHDLCSLSYIYYTSIKTVLNNVGSQPLKYCMILSWVGNCSMKNSGKTDRAQHPSQEYNSLLERKGNKVLNGVFLLQLGFL